MNAWTSVFTVGGEEGEGKEREREYEGEVRESGGAGDPNDCVL